MTTRATYRAAGWISDDGMAEVRLTTEDQQYLTDEDLIAAAEIEAAANDLDLENGSIQVGQWTE